MRLFLFDFAFKFLYDALQQNCQRELPVIPLWSILCFKHLHRYVSELYRSKKRIRKK